MASTRRTCPECGIGFFPYPGPTSPLCRSCRQAAKRQRDKEGAKRRRAEIRAAAPPREFVCEACGLLDSEAQGINSRRFCRRSECRTARNTARMQRYFEGYAERTGKPYVIKRNPETRQRNSAERRARTRGARVGAPFTRQYIGERDSWQCALCGQPIDPTLKWPDPMSQSLEHIVPLALGGEHSKDNCTIAHLSCNSRGGTRHAQARARMLHNLQ
jgi:5-methylcytosine-specific restriction endonuclease McrA